MWLASTRLCVLLQTLASGKEILVSLCLLVLKTQRKTIPELPVLGLNACTTTAGSLQLSGFSLLALHALSASSVPFAPTWSFPQTVQQPPGQLSNGWASPALPVNRSSSVTSTREGDATPITANLPSKCRFVLQHSLQDPFRIHPSSMGSASSLAQ